MRRLNRTILSGGVAYPAGQAATPELEAAITNPKFWDDDTYVAPDPVTVPAPADPVVDDYPSYTDKPRPDGWENFTDDQKRGYIYGTAAGPADQTGDDVDANQAPTQSPGGDPVEPAPVTPVDYSSWSYDQLVAEIKARNDQRDEAHHVKVASRKADDLAAALAADDEVPRA